MKAAKMLTKVNKKIADTLNFFSKLSIRKLLNYFKLLAGYCVSILSGKVIFQALPAVLSIEPTTKCNLKCPECPGGLQQFTRKTGNMDFKFYKSIIDQSYKDLIYLMLYFQGEPFLHPDFFEMVKYAHKRKIYTTTSTNAHFLDKENAKKVVESGLDRIIISIDGTTQESYEKYRIGGKLEKVVDGTKNLINARNKFGSNKPYIIYQFVVFKSNEYEINALNKLAKEIGVDDVKIKTAQFYNLHWSNELIPTRRKFLRYKKEDGNYYLKGKLPNKCWRSWHSSVITIDGKIVPCCFDKDAKHELGDLKTDSMKKIVKGKSIKEFKNSILKNRKKFDICRNCIEGIRVFR